MGFTSQSRPSAVQTCSSDPDTTSGTETTVVFFKNSAGVINSCATSGFAPLWPNLSPREQGIIHLQSLGLQQPCRGAAGKLLFEPHLQSNLLPVRFPWWCWGPGGLQFHLPARWQLRFSVLCAGHGTATTLLAQPAATALAGGCSCKSCFLQVKRKPGVWPHSPQPPGPHAAPAAAAGMASPSMQPAWSCPCSLCALPSCFWTAAVLKRGDFHGKTPQTTSIPCSPDCVTLDRLVRWNILVSCIHCTEATQSLENTLVPHSERARSDTIQLLQNPPHWHLSLLG